MLHSSCVHSKGAVLVIIWGLLLNTLRFTGFTNITQLEAIVMAFVYLLYPISGLLGEKWMRFKILFLGAVVIAIGCISSLVIELVVIAIDRSSMTKLVIITNSIYILGRALFGANIIQFGVDQLQFAATHELSSFLYWLFWVFYLPGAVIYLIVSGITAFVYNYRYYVIGVFFGYNSIAIIVGFITLCCFKDHLIIEPAQHNNPVRLIWKVMRHVWKHKKIVRRSAFTYGEPPPSGLDLAKERYGGPFTTGQVEDVKSFWYMLIVFMGTYGLAFTSFSRLSNQYKNALQNNYSFIDSIVLLYSLTIPYMVVSIGIPIYQFVIVPFFSRYIPSMLKRMGIGLVLVLLQLVIITIISYVVNSDINETLGNSTCLELAGNSTSFQNITFTIPSSFLIIPHLLSGVSTILIFITGFEFVLAQAPRTMQGLLIGLWFMKYSITYVDETLANYYWSCYWHYYAIKTALVFISIIVFIIVAHRYRYRQRNELSDVNERVIITQYTERRLEREEHEHMGQIIHIEDVVREAVMY